ncbi:lipoprotein aminopeptidase LpqL [Nocardiopsis kunsanensis]|uniref:Lipoprotein aminopeptidase LpqL n=2 Tax=Nocardiopsis kunsanensis TaxID=141693 RepID=A0A918XCY9_9ACTN|nr:lipoprotein aminopeptidase LpqL [Nocardiopsis kunsanensis]
MAGASTLLAVMIISVGGVSAAVASHLPKSEDFDVQSVMGHIDRLQQIADDNGGHRAAGSAGHRESAEYFEEELREAGLEVSNEKFEFLYSKPSHASLSLDEEELDMIPATFGPSTDGDLRANPYVLVDEGCEDKHYESVTRGSILVLEEPKNCTVQEQHEAASESGAGALLVASSSEVPPYIWLDGAGSRDIPVAGISQQTSEAIQSSSEPLSMSLTMETERRSSTNLIAEKPGRSEEAIEVGAHLDSVPQSPGINDNAVSAAVLLEHAISKAEQSTDKAQRYMFWSGEEFAFAGSRSYLRSGTDIEGIAAYVNFEMVAAPNSGYFYIQNDGSGSSQLIDEAIVDGYAQIGIQAERDANEEPRSDDASYQDAGIPTGGFWGGSFETKTEEQAELWGGSSGEPFDECYHQVCDTADRIDEEKVSNTMHVVDYVLGTLDKGL